jgi:putative phosphoserine phosphatase/1-acylglycerol-3-phosphate O-acyltransferase
VRAAAFIDLDRTLLKGASGPIISRALRDAGVVGGSSLPGEDVLYRVFNVFGENLPSMLIARQGVTVMKGKPRHLVVAAAHSAVDQLMSLVRDAARAVIDSHKAEGRKVVLATTTPHDVIAPFARRLGFDDVVATRFAVDVDGNYSGELDGPFTWSAGKLEAVRAWCVDHDVSLESSYAYSDSIYDAPLLSAVGFPRAVNPDARLAAMAATRRWPVESFDHEGTTPKPPLTASDVQRVGLLFARPELLPFVRFDITGADRVPKGGPVILVANHRSYFDAFAVAMLVGKTGRTVRFLGKKEVFDAPVVGQLASLLGGIRVDRTSGSDEPLEHATAALASGEMVAIMPQGTIPRGPAFFDPELKGRWGAARLALATGAQIVPVGLWGTEKVWPRNSRLPNLAAVANPPRVTVTTGDPFSLGTNTSPTPEELDAATTRIMSAIVELLPEEAQRPYTPTEDELRRTYPSSYKGDPNTEATRRPGTD